MDKTELHELLQRYMTVDGCVTIDDNMQLVIQNAVKFDDEIIHCITFPTEVQDDY